MNLHKATFLLIFGSGYTILHKLAFALVPSLSNSDFGRTIASILWIVAAFTLILFAYQFLVELSPINKRMKFSLILIILFTSVVIIMKLPMNILTEGGIEYHLIFGFSSLLNSFAILLFALSFIKLISRGSQLWNPIRTLIWACSMTSILAVVSFSYFVAFLLKGQEIRPLPFLQPLSALTFLFTYSTTIWFLIRFSRITNYQDYAHK
jgi:hypothetical protein